MCKKLGAPPVVRTSKIFHLDFAETTPQKYYHGVYIYHGGLQVIKIIEATTKPDHEYPIQDFYITLQAQSCSYNWSSQIVFKCVLGMTSLFNKKWSGCYKKSQEAASFIENKK